MHPLSYSQELYRWDCGDNYFRANGLCVLLEEETSVAPFGNWDTQLQLCPECRHQYVGTGHRHQPSQPWYRCMYEAKCKGVWYNYVYTPKEALQGMCG